MLTSTHVLWHRSAHIYTHGNTHTKKTSQFKNKSNAPKFILLHLTYLEANQKASVLPLCINSCTNNTEPQPVSSWVHPISGCRNHTVIILILGIPQTMECYHAFNSTLTQPGKHSFKQFHSNYFGMKYLFN